MISDEQIVAFFKAIIGWHGKKLTNIMNETGYGDMLDYWGFLKACGMSAECNAFVRGVQNMTKCKNFREWSEQVNWWNARYKREVFCGHSYTLIWD